MILTSRILMAATGCKQTTADLWTPLFQTAIYRFSISAPQAIAALLANVSVESGCLTVFTENLNYTATGLARTWPNRFAADPTHPPYFPNAVALALANKPEQIANNVYANRLGNGPVESGDGWNFRGQGPIQITGKSAFISCGAAIGVDLLSNPSRLATDYATGALSSAWFFQMKGCIAAANAGNFNNVVKLINGALPGPANDGARRLALTQAGLVAMGITG